MSKKHWIVLLTVLLTFVLASSAYAFSDIKGDPAEESILALKEAGLVSGIGNDLFDPTGEVPYAQGVHLIVKGLGLNIDNIRFIKEPKASDYFENVPDDAWFAPSFIIAQLNGLPLAKDVDPSKPLTREQFARLLVQGLLKTGDYAFAKLLIIISDNDQINPENADSIQKLLVSGIARLDQDKRFRPQDHITRSEAASLVYGTIQFIKKQTENQPNTDKNVAVTSLPVNEDVNKIVLSWGEKPNNGYRITIESIEFKDERTAVVKYTLHYPEQGKLYGQMITKPEAETYVSSKFNVVIEQSPEHT